MEDLFFILKNRAMTIYTIIKSKKNQNYPTVYLNDLYNQLDEIYKEFIDKYLEEETEITNNKMFLIKQFIDGTNKGILDLLNNASNILEPKSITIPIREKIKKNNEKALYIPELIWEVNYYIGNVSEAYNKFLEPFKLNKKLTTEIYRFGIPYFYQNNVLMSGILGHELGHYFDLHGGLDITERLMAEFASDEILINQLEPFVDLKESRAIGNIFELKSNVVKLFLSQNFYFKAWVSEFVADVLGTMLYGPASILSSEYLIQSSSIQDDNLIDYSMHSHPRNVLRNQIKQLSLRKLNYYDTSFPDAFNKELEKNNQKWEYANKKYIPHTFKFDTQIGNLYMNINKQALGVMEDYLESKFDLIIDRCLEQLSDELIYGPDVMEKSINQLTEKIGELQPPNELHDNMPADSISIINASWLSYLEPSELMKMQYNTNNKRMNAIDRLSSRALEVASIHRRWNDVSSK